MARPIAWNAALLAMFLLSGSTTAFYLPGVAPEDFAKVRSEGAIATHVGWGRSLPPPCPSPLLPLPPQGDLITLKVNKLNSVKNLPYEYYSLPYCRPDKVKSKTENLGELLRGDRIENSPYDVSTPTGVVER
jgi:hypothetical protein